MSNFLRSRHLTSRRIAKLRPILPLVRSYKPIGSQHFVPFMLLFCLEINTQQHQRTRYQSRMSSRSLLSTVGSAHTTRRILLFQLFILLIRGLSLPGASLGLTFLFSSASDSISSLKVNTYITDWCWTFETSKFPLQMWSAAAEQVLFEIGVGVGALFSLAAYSRFRNNVYRDAALLITMYTLRFTVYFRHFCAIADNYLHIQYYIYLQ